MKQKQAFAFELKEATEAGEFVGLASVYGNRDLGGDVVERGAFTKTLRERGAEVPILWQHDQKNPIGTGTLTDSPDGLIIKGALDLDIEAGRRAYSGLKKGYLKGLSIGYDVVKQKRAGDTRHLIELKLYEVSTVTFPMNEEAEVTRVKHADLAAFDVKALGLPAPLEAAVVALFAKAASLSDRITGACTALREKFPLGGVYPLYDEIYDDYLIVQNGSEYFSVVIEAWSEDGVPTLGDAVEVERTYVPVTAADEAAEGEGDEQAAAAPDESSARGPLQVKVGRTISTANATKLAAAADHMAKAAKHVKDVIKSAAPKDTKSISTPEPGAATDIAGAELASLLSATTEQMRALTR